VGIPEDILDRVLEPFFTTKDVGKGTGLGLSMVYGFAQQSGGALRIESQSGQGTHIEIWLPRAEAGNEQVANEVVGQVIPLHRENGGGMRILLVDDHEATRTTIAALLVDVGHAVTHVADGRGIMEMLKSAPGDFDVLVTDFAMPSLSGAELIKRARQIVPALNAVIITGYAESELLVTCPDDVQILIKPFPPEQLLNALENVRMAKVCPEAAE
jgi:CheY-like chemotaxis protein